MPRELGYISKLQSVRGIAAVTVIVGHCTLMYENHHIVSQNFQLRPSNALLALSELIIQPNTAVTVFFVLSGLVLAQSLGRRADVPLIPRLISFAARRIGRLIPVAWVGIAFGAFILALVQPHQFPGNTQWWEAVVSVRTSAKEILSDLMSIGNQFNGVIWSIRVEFLIIPFLPIIAAAMSRCGIAVNLILVVLAAWVSLATWDYGQWLLMFFFAFMAGGVIPQLIENRRIARLLGSSVIFVMLILALLPIEWAYYTHQISAAWKTILNVTIATVLIAHVLLSEHSLLGRLLARRSFVFLGDISYSLYAISFPLQILIGYYLMRLFASDTSPGDLKAAVICIATALLVCAISIPLAMLGVKYLERPGTAFGHLIGNWIETTLHKKSVLDVRNSVVPPTPVNPAIAIQVQQSTD